MLLVFQNHHLLYYSGIKGMLQWNGQRLHSCPTKLLCWQIHALPANGGRRRVCSMIHLSTNCKNSFDPEAYLETMEKLLHCQVLENLQTNGLFYEHQTGIQLNHSTVTQLCRLTNKWQMTLDKRPFPNCISGSHQGLRSSIYFWPFVQAVKSGVFRRNFALVLIFFSQTDSNVSNFNKKWLISGIPKAQDLDLSCFWSSLMI